MKHSLKSRSGQVVTLTTDDTFTLAIGRERIESTPQSLAQIFSKRSLQRLRARTHDQSEQTKLDRAIAIAE